MWNKVEMLHGVQQKVNKPRASMVPGSLKKGSGYEIYS